ncbi:unnamed protein product [Symbiodinium sp. CCMP2456]|nr:unnamed protein product [Symbiodinium sp. CCMP2456]
MRGARAAAARAAEAKKAKAAVRALEADVGLNCFLTPGRKLAGKLLSNRITSDFQRHDVLPSGEVLHLGSLGCPPEQVRATEPEVHPRIQRQRRSSETNRRTHDKAWAAVLYSEATEAPASPRRRLALALGVPETALRLGPGLHLPGVSVEVVRLPRGLPDLEVTPELRAGVLGKKGETLALGPPDLTQSLGMTDVACPAHRYTIVLRNLSEQKVAEGSYDERLEEIQQKGFANFFELSSFGLAEVRRYHGSKQTTRFCDVGLVTLLRKPDPCLAPSETIAI